jgi:hypothetical protein
VNEESSFNKSTNNNVPRSRQRVHTFQRPSVAAESKSENGRKRVKFNFSEYHKKHSLNRTRRPKKAYADPDSIRNVTKANSTNTRLPKPILVVGFPKAGTSSIFEFFNCNGVYSQHWFCCDAQANAQRGGPGLMAGCMLENLANHTPIFQGCGDYDVLSEMNGPRPRKRENKKGSLGLLMDDGSYDYQGPGPRIFLPQHFNLEELHQQHPNATWILNLRPVDAWVKSIMKWNKDLKFEFAHEYYMQSSLDRLPRNDGEMAAFLARIYEEHNERIRDFCVSHPSHALVEVNITGDAGKVLADAFELDDSCWVHKNKNERKRRPRDGLRRVMDDPVVIFLDEWGDIIFGCFAVLSGFLVGLGCAGWMRQWQ